MIIDHVDSNGFKGKPLSMDLPLVLVLTGENGSGKSKVPEACITAIQGSIPWTRYKTAAAIYEKYVTDGAGNLVTNITLSNGADTVPIRRTMKQTGGSVKQKLEYRGNSKLQEAQAMIDEDLNLCAKALDFAAFENITPREQQLYLLGLVQIPDTFERDSLREQVAQSLMNASQRHFKTCEKCRHCIHSVEGFRANDPLAKRSNNTPMGHGECDLEVGKQVKLDSPGCANWEGFDEWEDELKSLFGIGTDITNDLFEAWNDTLMDEMCAYPGRPVTSIRENIEALEKRSREMKTEVQNNVNRLIKLNESQIDAGIRASQEADKPKGITGTTAEIKSTLDALRETEKKLIAEIEKEAAKATAHADWLKDHRDFQDDVEQGNERYNNSLQQQRDEKFEAKIKAVRKKIKAADWYEQKQQELNDLEAKCMEYYAAKEGAENVVADLRAKIDMKKNVKRVFSQDKVQCPLLGSGCRVHQKEKPEIIGDATTGITRLEKELAAATIIHDESKREHDELVAEINTATGEIADAKTDDASCALTIKEFEGKEKILVEAIDLAKSNLDRDNERLSNHLANDKRVDSSDDSEALEAKKAEAQADIEKYQAAYDIKADEDRREADRKRTIEELNAARERLTLTKELVRIVGPAGILGDVLTASLAPMINSINENLPDGRSCYIHPEGSGIDIGMRINGDGRSLMSLSDGEKSLFAAATALAFMILKKSNLKLLIINRFEAIDDKRQAALLGKIVTAAAQYGIQFIGCSCKPVPVVEGVSYIEMEGDA